MIDIDYASSQLVKYLKECGSENESNIYVGREDNYKPFYRTITLFIAPTLPYLDEVLNGEEVTGEQVKEIMRKADPYFVYALDKDGEEFDYMWNDMKDVWKY